MDAITPDERRMIDEALRAGKVTLTSTAIPTLKPFRHAGRKPCPKVAARRAAVRDLISQGKCARTIAATLGIQMTTVRADAAFLDLTITRGRRANAGDEAVERKTAVAKKKVAALRDRRRFKIVPVPIGNPGVMAPADAEGTIFPDRVFDPVGTEMMLKDGSSHCKIGGDVLLGWLKGARIYTLTLEERATCPRSCFHWRSCYGNSMPHARRWKHGPEMMRQLADEVTHLCGLHERVLIRLHVLGDFWDLDYVELWDRLLNEHENLFAFGFTAHKRGTSIGDRITEIRSARPGRFWIRHSDMTGSWGSFTLDFPTQQKKIGDAIVCPEQRDGMEGSIRGTHCGNCAVCWSSAVPVAFVTH